MLVVGAILGAVMSSGGESSGHEVTRQAFVETGRTWPLTVDRGQVDCEQGMLLTFTAPDGTRYGINGTAQSKLGLPPIDAIWARQTTQDGQDISTWQLGVNTDDLFAAARVEC